MAEPGWACSIVELIINILINSFASMMDLGQMLSFIKKKEKSSKFVPEEAVTEFKHKS